VAETLISATDRPATTAAGRAIGPNAVTMPWR
jgi:hypothetical protein